MQVVKLSAKGKKLKLKQSFKDLFKGYEVDEFKTFFAHSWAGKELDFKYDTAPKLKKNYIHCEDLWTEMAISWDGLAVPCCLDLNADVVLADVNKVDTLSVWNSEPMIELRKKLINKAYQNLPLCKGCDKLFEEKRSINKLYFKIYRLFQK
jgi:hypothetical protein